jgi:L-asparaginase
MVQPDNSKIVILGTGGTIAGTAAQAGDNIGYRAAQVGVDQLIRSVASLSLVLGEGNLVTEQVAQVDSKDMGFAVWRELALRCAHWLADTTVKGIVITHGTDTLEETAWFLQSVLQPRKPVVLTCAMRPATALAPDGPQNILDAVTVALDPLATGVVAVCAGVVHSARDVQKDHPYRLDAFSSGDAGPLGFVEENAVRWVKFDEKTTYPSVDRSFFAIESIVDSMPWPRVEIVMNYAGASGAMVDMLVRDGVQGLVAAGTGNGSLHQDLEAALIRAQVAGVKVVRATRCAQGRVLSHSGDRIADSHGLSPVKARVTLILELLGAQATGLV